ncbi:MAG: prephenate dehydratase [Methanomassiliicoccales archaeon]|nr:prephenate dehydratase [Methanomassiliicoccales archaeon]
MNSAGAERKVAFQGIHGAYSEDAVYKFFGEGIRTLPCAEFEDVFASVDKGDASHAVVPVENSLEGSVARVNDLLLEHDLTVVGEVIIFVKHCLIGHPDAEIEDIRRVYSHPQALGQCRTFLSRYPQWEKVPSYDTAGSVKIIKERGDRSEAAIASARTAKEYGMKILKEGIQNSHLNYTRFFVIEKAAAINPRGDKTSLVFATKNVAGALYACLGVFTEHSVNLTKLESRPRRDRAWEYVFYVDIDGHLDDPDVSGAITDLVRRASFVKILGSYKRAELPSTQD